MVSEETFEILKDRCEEHEAKAQNLLQTDPRQAVYHFSKAADAREKLAAEVDSNRVETAHRSKADSLRSNAHRLMLQLGIAEESEVGDWKTSADRETEILDDEPPSDEFEAGADVESLEFFAEPPDSDFSDVGGMAELKQRLREDVQEPLEQPEFYERQSAGIENGVLLYGPPGTGKSFLANCFAGELGHRYAEVHASDIVSKWVGEASKNVRQLFDEARACAPCVLFVDELDALATDRSSGTQKTNSERQLVNELLQQMQRIQGTEVLVMAATNKPTDLDEAITRSQRFNQLFEVGPPDADAREEILKVQLDDGHREVEWGSINWSKLVDWSQGFSAADLALVVERAARMSADESTDRGELVPVEYRHLLKNVKETEASLKHWNSGGTE